MQTLGIFGLGAFGQLITPHLKKHFQVIAYDVSSTAKAFAIQQDIGFESVETVATADIIVLAVPVNQIADLLKAIKHRLKPDALVLDVTSVKLKPVGIMLDLLPKTVDIIATHPLFGPQSAKNGITGLKIAVCAVRTKRMECVNKFLESDLGLRVIMTTPEEHDREVAAVQGLSHLIAKVLVEMEPLPTRMTTTSFDLIMQAVEMVRYDSIELFLAIGRDNPYSADVRHRFFEKADALQKLLESHNNRP